MSNIPYIMLGYYPIISKYINILNNIKHQQFYDY